MIRALFIVLAGGLILDTAGAAIVIFSVVPVQYVEWGFIVVILSILATAMATASRRQ